MDNGIPDFDFDGLPSLRDEIALDDLFLIPTQSLAFKRESGQRFGDVLTSHELDRKIREGIPKKTRSNNKWAMGVWAEWVFWRNHQPETMLDPNYPIPADIATLDPAVMDYWLAFFVQETRPKDGKPYPPNTLMQIVSGKQRYLRDECRLAHINIFKKDDPTFAKCRKALDERMKSLTKQGVGIHVQHADPVTKDEEIQFWDKGIFSLVTAEGLSNAVFFYNGAAFGFRSLTEHNTCMAEMFQIRTDPSSGLKYIQYRENASKTLQGGLNQRKLTPKEVKHYEQKDNPRCLVKLYDKYLSLIPSKGELYRKPLPPSTKHIHPRFSAGTISQKDAEKMYVKFFKEAGIDTTDRKITNHSGRVTCATNLYNQDFDDKAVCSRTFHRSSAVNIYKRELPEKLRDISNAVAPPSSGQLSKSVCVSQFSGNVKKEDLENQIPVIPSTISLKLPDNINCIVIVKNGKQIKIEV